MKAFIQKTFLNENCNYSITKFKGNNIFTNNKAIININSEDIYENKFYNKINSFSTKNQRNNKMMNRIFTNLPQQNSFINLSKKWFSRNSAQWLNRHTNDVYVKKSVEVKLYFFYKFFSKLKLFFSNFFNIDELQIKSSF